jgi:hypothetical protein
MRKSSAPENESWEPEHRPVDRSNPRRLLSLPFPIQSYVRPPVPQLFGDPWFGRSVPALPFWAEDWAADNISDRAGTIGVTKDNGSPVEVKSASEEEEELARVDEDVKSGEESSETLKDLDRLFSSPPPTQTSVRPPAPLPFDRCVTLPFPAEDIADRASTIGVTKDNGSPIDVKSVSEEEEEEEEVARVEEDVKSDEESSGDFSEKGSGEESDGDATEQTVVDDSFDVSREEESGEATEKTAGDDSGEDVSKEEAGDVTEKTAGDDSDDDASKEEAGDVTEKAAEDDSGDDASWNCPNI